MPRVAFGSVYGWWPNGRVWNAAPPLSRCETCAGFMGADAWERASGRRVKAVVKTAVFSYVVLNPAQGKGQFIEMTHSSPEYRKSVCLDPVLRNGHFCLAVVSDLC